MPRRQVGQLGWLDGALARRGSGRADTLSSIAQMVEWAPFERALNGIHGSPRGEAAYPPLVMFKVLLLQSWYGLRDEEMEAALFDRISFLRFVGLSAEDVTPDHSTIWRFRNHLSKPLTEALFGELQRQLAARGVLVKNGTLIDASIVPSAARRPTQEEGPYSAVDPDARFGTDNTRKRYTFGYKIHVAVDRGSGLVRALRLSPANEQEVMHGTALVQGDETAVYADRAYDAARMHDHLAAHGIANGILRRRRAGVPLTPQATAHNHACARKRRPVEAVFGTLKRSYGFHRMPYFNAARNGVACMLACFAYNLRRWHTCTTG